MDDPAVLLLPYVFPSRHERYLADYRHLCVTGLPPERAARDALAGTMPALVRRYARGMCRGWPAADPEDAYGEGMVGVARATQQFDPARGVQFCSYATRAAIRSIMSYRTLAARFGFTMTDGAFVRGPETAGALGVDEEWAWWLQSVCADPAPAPGDDPGWDADVWAAAAGQIHDGNYRAAFLAYFRDRRSYREIAAELGVCYNQVAQYVQAGARRLRKRALDGAVYLPGQEAYSTELT